jgi:predicted amidophosphoribosyltransferase
LGPEELAHLQFEIETCELHLFELTGETPEGRLVCPSCGSGLKANAKFCGKCGASIKGASCIIQI